MFGAYTLPGRPFSMLMSWPAPSAFGRIGASCAVQSFSERQAMQLLMCLMRELPRASRSVWLSNFIAVRARERGPMKWRQLMVTVIPTAATTDTAENTHPRIFPRLVILIGLTWLTVSGTVTRSGEPARDAETRAAG